MKNLFFFEMMTALSNPLYIACATGLFALLIVLTTIYRIYADTFKIPLNVRLGSSGTVVEFMRGAGDVIGTVLMWGSVLTLGGDTGYSIFCLAGLMCLGSMSYYYAEVLLPTIWHPMHVSRAWAAVAIYYIVVDTLILCAIANRGTEITTPEFYIMAEMALRAVVLVMRSEDLRDLVLKESQRAPVEIRKAKKK